LSFVQEYWVCVGSTGDGSSNHDLKATSAISAQKHPASVAGV
jgi:hypothetical protein